MKFLILSILLIGAVVMISVIKNKDTITKSSFWLITTVLTIIEILLFVALLFTLHLGYNS